MNKKNTINLTREEWIEAAKGLGALTLISAAVTVATLPVSYGVSKIIEKTILK